MKWYERQKQMYAQKNQNQTPKQPQQTAANTQAQEQEIIQPQVNAEAQSAQSSYGNDAFDEMLKEDNYQAYEQEPSYQDTQSYEAIQDQRDHQPYENTQSYQEDESYEQTQSYAERSYQRSQFTANQNKSSGEDTTTISKSTVIHGNIEADGDLVIQGHVQGDILCNANLSIYGIVEGTISCNNAYLDNAIVVGDIGCGGNMQVSESSTINGNVEAYELLNGGRIKGNAMVSEGVKFLSTSAIVGDVSANDIQVKRGAVIQGNIIIRQEVYFNEN